MDALSNNVNDHSTNCSFFKTVLYEDTLTLSIIHSNVQNLLILFLDLEHNLKNIYNNLYNKKVLVFPDIDNPTITKTARFHDICSLYGEDIKRLLKLAHKLTAKAFESKNKKTLVKLVSVVFYDRASNALQYFSASEEKQWARTASLINIVLTMYNIVCVKTLSTGHNKRDLFRELIVQCDNFKLKYLKTFVHLLKHGFLVDCLGFPEKHAWLSTSNILL